MPFLSLSRSLALYIRYIYIERDTVTLRHCWDRTSNSTVAYPVTICREINWTHRCYACGAIFGSILSFVDTFASRSRKDDSVGDLPFYFSEQLEEKEICIVSSLYFWIILKNFNKLIL